jgi:tripeptide aminopeptidase
MAGKPAQRRNANFAPMATVLDRFVRYVQIDTQSDPQSNTFPSTEKQKDLGRLLAQELQDLGYDDAHMDEHGYVYATIPAVPGCEQEPVICFCAHMDTSPDSSGSNVKPQIHAYQGGDILYPGFPELALSPKDHPDLAKKAGHLIVTSDGSTLLGADNKSGVAEIMTIADELRHSDIKHGAIRILFTPDEEVGRGTEKVDLEKLGASFGYTFDGEEVGTIEDETWSADGAKIRIQGVSHHPGFAKGRLVNAMKVAADFIDALPKNTLSPETTEGREGFVHPTYMHGTAEEAEIHLILRDFTRQGLAEKGDFLNRSLDEALKKWPGAKGSIELSEQYRNMKEVLDLHPEVIDRALEAMRRCGLEPERRSIRGGTDGSRLSFMGLPCANIFAGEHAFHSRLEWVSVEDMEMAVKVGLEIARV